MIPKAPKQRALRLATRTSALAQWQATWVADRVLGSHLVGVSTVGDRKLDVPVSSFGGRAVFVREVQQALFDDRADVAVHSAKDLPSRDVPGLFIAAVPKREDPRDALVGRSLERLGPGACIATGAPRRRAQLSWHRPDLTFAGLRGNIQTRLTKLPSGGAIVMAVAALSRLGLTEHISEILDPSIMLPQAGQGTLALECRQDDIETIEALAALDHEPSHRCLDAERSFLAALGAGCDTPAGAFAQVMPSGDIHLEAVLSSGDGHILFRRMGTGPDGVSVGTSVAQDMLENCGAATFLGHPARLIEHDYDEPKSAARPITAPITPGHAATYQ